MVVICVDESAEAMVNEPKIPFAVIWLALLATALSCGLDIEVASTVTPEAPARKAANSDALSVASAIDLAALQENASLASNTVSLSSSASQALPCASLSQFAWLALAVVGQLSLFDATPQAVNGPEPTPSPSTSAWSSAVSSQSVWSVTKPSGTVPVQFDSETKGSPKLSPSSSR